MAHEKMLVLNLKFDTRSNLVTLYTVMMDSSIHHYVHFLCKNVNIDPRGKCTCTLYMYMYMHVQRLREVPYSGTQATLSNTNLRYDILE